MLYEIAVFIHLVSAITWVGGTIFLVLVLVPVIRSGMVSPSQSARLLAEVARRFRPVAWTSIALLVATGLFMAIGHWHVSLSGFFSDTGWFKGVLRVKVGFVALVIVLSVIHDFVLGPRVSNLMESLRQGGAPPTGTEKSRQRLVLLARTNLLLVLVIISLAIMLTRGSPF